MTPTRAARICGTPGCPNFTPCPEHSLTRNQRQGKDPAQKKFYSSARWTKISLMVRRQEPFCRLCKRNRSQLTDHEDGNWTNCARENLRALCRPCNDTLTAKQHRAKVGTYG